MDETKRKYRILYFLLNELATKDANGKLAEILNDQRLAISNPSLISFKKAFQNMKRLTDIEKKEILINFEKEINLRLEIVKVIENNLTNQTFIKSVEQLKQLEQEIIELDDQLKQLSKEYTEEAIDFIDNESKFKQVLDINQLNYELNQLQNLLVKIRLEKAERIHLEYGNEDKIKELKNERDQLLNQLKQYNLKEQQLIERKRMIEQMNTDLVNNYKNLKNNYKITEWVLSTLEK